MTRVIAVTARTVTRGVILARDLALAIVVMTAIAPLWCLPWRAAAALGRGYGRLAFVGWPLGRRAGMINLRRSYGPAMTRREAARVIGRVFANMGQSLAEALQFARRHRDGRGGWDRSYEVEDAALEARLLCDPRPKVFVTGHLGSWEIATMVMGLRAGSRGAAIARRVDNPFLNAIVRLTRFREASQWIEKRGGAAEALRRLQAGDSIAVLLDENAGARGVFVEFFDRAASTGKTAALLSLMTGAPIVLGAVVRQAGGKLVYKLAAIEPPRDAGPAAIRTLTQQIMRVWEQWVRADPDQWRWIHWRWKSRPDGTEEQYTHRDLVACFGESRSVRPGSEKNVPEATR